MRSFHLCHFFAILTIIGGFIGVNELKAKIDELKGITYDEEGEPVEGDSRRKLAEEEWIRAEESTEVKRRRYFAVTRQIAQVRKVLGWGRLYAQNYKEERVRYTQLLDPGNAGDPKDFPTLINDYVRAEAGSLARSQALPREIEEIERVRDETRDRRYQQWQTDNPRADTILRQVDELQDHLHDLQDHNKKALEVHQRRVEELQKRLAWEKEIRDRVIVAAKDWVKREKAWADEVVERPKRLRKLDPNPDGTVLLARSQEQMAVINRGSAHGMKEGFVFRIIHFTKGGEQVFKAMGRVYEVHAQVSRMKYWGEDIQDPVVTGDQILSRVFHPGKQYSFYFTGRAETLTDRVNEELMVIVKYYGHTVHAKLSNDTDVLVLSKPRNADDPNEMARIIKDLKKARENGSSVISSYRLLDFIGYHDFKHVWEKERRVKTKMSVRDFLRAPPPPTTPVFEGN